MRLLRDDEPNIGSPSQLRSTYAGTSHPTIRPAIQGQGDGLMEGKVAVFPFNRTHPNLRQSVSNSNEYGMCSYTPSALSESDSMAGSSSSPSTPPYLHRRI